MAIFDKISGISTGSGFKYQSEAPLDARLVVDYYSELAELVAATGAYAGMLVYVKNETSINTVTYPKGYYSYDGTTWTEFKGTDTIGDYNVQADWNETNDASDAFIKNKPNVIIEGDQRLTDARTPKAHNQAATTITEDATHRFVTDTEKSAWNAKSNFSGSYNDLTNKPTIPVDTNQTLKIGSVTFGANDVIEFVPGSNVSISGDAATKKITIRASDTNTETTLIVTDKTKIDTTDLVYAVTNLVEGGTKGHTITPTYTGIPTKTYVDKIATGHVKYLGTVVAVTELSTTAGQGDFYRVSTQFTFGSEIAHVGDIILATKDNPTQNITDWDLIHTEVSNTWVENQINNLISSGTVDPSADTASKYYFKY